MYGTNLAALIKSFKSLRKFRNYVMIIKSYSSRIESLMLKPMYFIFLEVA